MKDFQRVQAVGHHVAESHRRCASGRDGPSTSGPRGVDDAASRRPATGHALDVGRAALRRATGRRPPARSSRSRRPPSRAPRAGAPATCLSAAGPPRSARLKLSGILSSASRSTMASTRAMRFSRCSARNAISAGIARLEEVAQHVDVAAVQDGRDLDAGHGLDAARGGEPQHVGHGHGGVVIGDRHGGQARGRGKLHQLARAWSGRRTRWCGGGDRSPRAGARAPRRRARRDPPCPGASRAHGTRASAGRGARAPRRRTPGRSACLPTPRTARRIS